MFEKCYEQLHFNNVSYPTQSFKDCRFFGVTQLETRNFYSLETAISSLFEAEKFLPTPNILDINADFSHFDLLLLAKIKKQQEEGENIRSIVEREKFFDHNQILNEDCRFLHENPIATVVDYCCYQQQQQQQNHDLRARIVDPNFLSSLLYNFESPPAARIRSKSYATALASSSTSNGIVPSASTPIDYQGSSAHQATSQSLAYPNYKAKGLNSSRFYYK
uniref:Uncharacterized protein n=1 Tax=Romanomermis culicivorax TaxID=13658 RepID=A0A915KBM5_ROMCU